MNIYIVLTANCEYVAAFASEQKAKDFIAACNQAADYTVRVDWLIGLED